MLATLTRPIHGAVREVGRELATIGWPGQRSLTELIAVLHVATAVVEDHAAEVGRVGEAADLLAGRLAAVERLGDSIDRLKVAVDRLAARLDAVEQAVEIPAQVLSPPPAPIPGPGLDRIFGLRRHRDDDRPRPGSPATGNGAAGQ